MQARGELGRPVGRVGERGGFVAPGEEDDAQAARSPGVGLCAPGRVAVRERPGQHLGSAEHVRASPLAVGEGKAAPLALGREERLVGGRQALRRKGGAERFDGTVPSVVLVAKAPSRRAARASSAPSPASSS